MIKDYRDHAANERTFLAWVRTAIALMAFGFLLERFDLFLQMAALSLGQNAPHVPAARFGRDAGLALLLLGVVMNALAAYRFLKTRKGIDSEQLHVVTGVRADIALAGLLALLGISLAFYLAHAIMAPG